MARSYKSLTNEQIISAIKRTGSDAFQTSIPDPIKASVQESAKQILSFTANRNEFTDALVNRIGKEYVNFQTFRNPLAKFKDEEMFFGDTMEEIAVGLTKAQVYDPSRDALERDIFSRKVPDVRTAFHKINAQRHYDITIQEPMLRRAFTQPFGLDKLVAALMQSPITSDERDEFLLMTNLFREWYRMGGFFRVQVPNLASSTATEQDAKVLLRNLREFASILSYPETDYNPARMPVAADPEDFELFITPEAKSAIDVEALAAAFNVSYADFDSRTTVIPGKYMPIPGVQAILTTRQWFKVVDTLRENTTADNPIGLHQNYFYHHHQIVSASPFQPAIMFWTGEGDNIEIEDTPVESVTISVQNLDGETVTEVERGEVYRVITSTVTTPLGGYNTGVRIEIDPTSETTSDYTYLRQTGSFMIGLDEESESITINGFATDTDFPQTVEDVTVTVTGKRVEFWPNPAVYADPDSATPGAVYEADPDITGSNATNAGKLAAKGYVADPATAWTTGDKITIGEYDFHWSGTAWAAGAAA